MEPAGVIWQGGPKIACAPQRGVNGGVLRSLRVIVRTVIRFWPFRDIACALPKSGARVADRYRNLSGVLQGPCHVGENTQAIRRRW